MKMLPSVCLWMENPSGPFNWTVSRWRLPEHPPGAPRDEYAGLNEHVVVLPNALYGLVKYLSTLSPSYGFGVLSVVLDLHALSS